MSTEDELRRLGLGLGTDPRYSSLRRIFGQPQKQPETVQSTFPEARSEPDEDNLSTVIKDFSGIPTGGGYSILPYTGEERSKRREIVLPKIGEIINTLRKSDLPFSRTELENIDVEAIEASQNVDTESLKDLSNEDLFQQYAQSKSLGKVPALGLTGYMIKIGAKLQNLAVTHEINKRSEDDDTVALTKTLIDTRDKGRGGLLSRAMKSKSPIQFIGSIFGNKDNKEIVTRAINQAENLNKINMSLIPPQEVERQKNPFEVERDLIAEQQRADEARQQQEKEEKARQEQQQAQLLADSQSVSPSMDFSVDPGGGVTVETPQGDVESLSLIHI